MGSATTETPRDFVVTSVKIEREKLEALKRVAASERRNVSQQVRWLIDRNVAEHDEEIAA